MPHVSQGRYHCLRFTQTDLYAPANLSHFPDLCALAVGANRIPFWVDIFCWEAEGTLLRTPASCVLSGSRGWACRCQKARRPLTHQARRLRCSWHRGICLATPDPYKNQTIPFKAILEGLQHASATLASASTLQSPSWHKSGTGREAWLSRISFFGTLPNIIRVVVTSHTSVKAQSLRA